MTATLRYLLLVAAAGAAFLGGFALQRLLPNDETIPTIAGLLWPAGEPLSGFSLEDQHGRGFDAADLHGSWSLLFFGFTHCPDVCPATLAIMADTMKRTRAAGVPPEALRVLMVSVDPGRDSGEQLGRYLAYFDDDFIGLRGTDDALGALTRQLGAIYVRAEPDETGNYSVDHTAALFLIDPQGRRVGVFTAPHDAADIAARIIDIRDFVSSS